MAGAADTTVVLLAPGMGDGIQAAKAGILEIGDVYVVNKSDREGAAQVRRDLRSMLALTHGSRGTQDSDGAWRPPVLGTTATSGDGVAEVVDALEAHLAWSRGSGALDRRRRGRARDEIESIALATLRRRWAGVADREPARGAGREGRRARPRPLCRGGRPAGRGTRRARRARRAHP